MVQKVILDCKTLAPNGSIAGVGGIDQATNTQIHYIEAQAIAAIDSGTLVFEVHGKDHVARVRVSHHGAHRFLETHRDGTKSDNLEALKICNHVPVHPLPVAPPYRPAPIQRGHCAPSKLIGGGR